MAVAVDVENTVRVTILNGSRNIIILSAGVPLVEVGLEKVVKVEFE
jgi:hypothetical protein